MKLYLESKYHSLIFCLVSVVYSLTLPWIKVSITSWHSVLNQHFSHWNSALNQSINHFLTLCLGSVFHFLVLYLESKYQSLPVTLSWISISLPGALPWIKILITPCLGSVFYSLVLCLRSKGDSSLFFLFLCVAEVILSFHCWTWFFFLTNKFLFLTKFHSEHISCFPKNNY